MEFCTSENAATDTDDCLMFLYTLAMACVYTSMKNIFQIIMYGDVGMAVPKTTQTRYMDGSVQATQKTTQVTPSLHFFHCFIYTKLFPYLFYSKKECRDGVTCVVVSVACTLPSLHPSTFLENVVHTCLCTIQEVVVL